jgi:hypothetical protein
MDREEEGRNLLVPVEDAEARFPSAMISTCGETCFRLHYWQRLQLLLSTVQAGLREGAAVVPGEHVQER